MIRSTNGSRGIPGVSYTTSGGLLFNRQVQAPNLGAASGRWASTRIAHRLPPYASLNNAGTALSAAGTNYTFLIRRPAPIKEVEGKVFGFQLAIENWKTGSAQNFALIKAATQTVFAGGHANPNGTPVNVLFSSANGCSSPPGALFPGGTLSGDDNSGIVISDYTHLESVPRTDGGEYPLYDFRLLSTDQSAVFAGRPAAQPTGVGPIEFCDQWTAADRCTVWDPYVGAAKPYECAPQVWVIWYTSVGKIVADLLGDSVISGSATIGGRRSIAALGVVAAGLVPNCVAHPSSVYGSTSQIIARDIGTAKLSGKVAILKCTSEVNDGLDAIKRLRWFSENIEIFRKNGVLPLVIGPTPFDTPLMGDIIDFLNKSGLPWFNTIPYLGADGGTDIRHFEAGFSGDDIHPNDAGVNVTYPAFAEWVRQQIQSVGF